MKVLTCISSIATVILEENVKCHVLDELHLRFPLLVVEPRV